MKILITIMITIAALLGLGAWINDSLQGSSDLLSVQIEKVCQDIQKESWDDANQKTRQLEIKWEENARWWPIILDHQEMDNIEFSLAKAKEFVATENRSLALGQLSEMKLMIEHLPAKEKINLKNIL